MTTMGKAVKKKNKEFKPTGKRGRLIVRNLPFKCTENDIFTHFNKFGEIKDINLLRRPDKKLVGCGFVEFASRQNADKAKAELNGQSFLGRQIYIETAKSQNVYDGSTPKKEEEGSEDENMDCNEIEVKEEPYSSDDESTSKKTRPKKEPFDSGYAEASEEFTRGKVHTQNQKENKQKNNIKKARLIVRNLSFKSTEQKLKEHFSQFGEVLEVLLLRKADKSLVGCGFVQFNKKLHAAKAIHHASGKPFLGRPIIVDWAIPKDKFRKFQEDSIKKEIKDEDEPNNEELDKEESEKLKIKQDDNSNSESDSESESDNKSEDEDSEDEDDESENEGDGVKEEKKVVDSRKLRIDDVDEGKTVFVKNLPFSVSDQEFRERVEEFGPVFYALVCKDKLTEHSKGSGFVKFKNKEDAEKCLSSGTEFCLKGNILDPHPALKRSEAQQKTEKSKEKKDKRNLYLMKEGMIIAGTPAAKGVSVQDMEHRLQLEQSKSSKLRNLNMFVSPTRLVVHNLPPSLSDKKLRSLFLKHAGPKAVIKEARIMRDLKQSDSAGKTISKGYGFLGFERHEDALKALRSINNNPNIFTPTARPIVSFSVENKTVLNAKRKRLERSRQKNPLCKDYKPDDTEEQGPAKKGKFVKSTQNENEEEEPEFAGISAKRGGTVKMRQKYKLKNQVQQHVQDVRKQKREMKLSRKARRSEHLKNKQVEKKATKKNKHFEKDTAFSSMVDKYKSKILSQSVAKKKWYDD